MTYVLMIWTVVAITGSANAPVKLYDWRNLAEFHYLGSDQLCEEAAKKLKLEPGRYQCIRSK